MASILATAVAIFPVSFIWAFSKPILVFLGQDVEIARRASVYLQILIPSVLTFALRQCILSWFQVQRIVKPFTINATIVAIASVPLTYVLVKKLDYVGGALAMTILTVLHVFLDTAYVYFSGIYQILTADPLLLGCSLLPQYSQLEDCRTHTPIFLIPLKGIYKKTWYGLNFSKAFQSFRPMLKLVFSSQLMVAGMSLLPPV